MNKKVVDLAKKHAMLAERNASYMLFENLAVLQTKVDNKQNNCNNQQFGERLKTVVVLIDHQAKSAGDARLGKLLFIAV